MINCNPLSMGRKTRQESQDSYCIFGDFDFVDGDEYIMGKEGRTIREIIDQEGETAFLEIEKKKMMELELDRKVISPGGSIIYHSDLMAYLGAHAVLIYLDDSFENIEARLAKVLPRGIVGMKNKTLKQIYKERRPLYLRYANITVRCSDKSPEQIVQEILRQFYDEETI